MAGRSLRRFSRLSSTVVADTVVSVGRLVAGVVVAGWLGWCLDRRVCRRRTGGRSGRVLSKFHHYITSILR